MEKAIPILLIFTLISGFNPFSLDASQKQLYLVDISAIEVTQAGTERYVPDAEISLVDLSKGQELKPYKITSSCSSYAFVAESKGLQYRVEVRNRDYRVEGDREIDLRKSKGYTWKVVYIKKTSDNLLNPSVDNLKVM